MNSNAYSFTAFITPKIMNLLISTSMKLKECSTLLANIPEKLKKRTQIQNFLGTLKLENTTLIPMDVVNIAQNKPLSIAPFIRNNDPKINIIENLWHLFEQPPANLNVFDTEHLLHTHYQLLKGSPKMEGRLSSNFRTTSHVFHDRQNKILTTAMSALEVKSHLDTIFNCAKKEQIDPIMVGAVIHFELLKAAPFDEKINGVDAKTNGILARLWHKNILKQNHVALEFLALEDELSQGGDDDYYEIFNQSILQNNNSIFLEFIIQKTNESIIKFCDKLQQLISNNDHVIDQANDQLIDQAIDQLNVQVRHKNDHVIHLEFFHEKRKMAVVTKLLKLYIGDLYTEKTNQELMQALHLKHRATFKQNYLAPALSAGLLSMTQPDSLRSPTQAYVLTLDGIDFLYSLNIPEMGRKK